MRRHKEDFIVISQISFPLVLVDNSWSEILQRKALSGEDYHPHYSPEVGKGLSLIIYGLGLSGPSWPIVKKSWRTGLGK